MTQNTDELALLIAQEEQNQLSIKENRKIIRIAMGKWVKNLQEGKVDLNSVHDIEVLMKLDGELRRQQL